MEKRQFESAKFCFFKAGDSENERVASAAMFVESGDKAVRIAGKAAVSSVEIPGKAEFIQAAEIYFGLGRFNDAAACYVKAREHMKAGECYETVRDNAKAADQYVLAKAFQKASDMYWSLDDIPSALDCAYKAVPRDFYQVIEKLLQAAQRGVVFDYEQARFECSKKAALYYHHDKKVDKMMHFLKMYPSSSDQRSFLSRF
jgi:tetratricopeptide (TPR) repeat protein